MLKIEEPAFCGDTSAVCVCWDGEATEEADCGVDVGELLFRVLALAAVAGVCEAAGA